MAASADADVPLGERALNALSDIVLVCHYDPIDAQAIVRWCNDAAVAATGLTREEMLGQPARTLFVDPGRFDQPDVRRVFLEAARRDGIAELTRSTSELGQDEAMTLRVRAFCRDPKANEIVIVVETPRR